MKRKDFVTAGLLGGITIINLPKLLLAKSSNYQASLMPFTIPDREPLKPGPAKTDVRTIIKSKQTNNQFSNIEVAVASKQMGPSPHLHKDLDELMYVLEGTATVMIGKEIFEVKACGWNFRLRGIVHSFGMRGRGLCGL